MDLGPLVRTFLYDRDQRRVSLFVGLGLFGLAAAFPGLYVLDPAAVGRTPLLMTPLCVLVAIAALGHLGYARRIRLDLHERGFVYRGNAVPFSRVRSVRYRLVHVLGGTATYNRGFLDVRLDDGTKVSPSMQLEPMDEVIGALHDGAMPTLVGGMDAALSAGQVLRLGPFELQREGIVCKGQSIPWARVAFTSSEEDLKLMDVDPEEGDSRDVHECKLHKVENAHALEALADQLRNRALRAAARG